VKNRLNSLLKTIDKNLVANDTEKAEKILAKIRSR